MRDLELYRRLVAGTATAAELAQVAAWPMSRRAPLLAYVAPLVSFDDPEMRAAALAALAGSRGITGVRAIVHALDDTDDRVRAAALDGLRATAGHAPHRYAHALFHPSAELRRAALSGPQPTNTHPMAIYLRADAATKDLAASVPWPDKPLPLAFQLHAAGHVPGRELVELFLQRPLAEMRGFLGGRVAQRVPEQVYPFVDQCLREGFQVAPGTDVIDTLIAAIVEAGDFGRPMERFVELVSPKRNWPLQRRAAAALISQLARSPRIELVPLCVGLEPRTLAIPGFPRAWIDAAVTGITTAGWMVGMLLPQLEKLFELPAVREPLDLALAAALAGVFPQHRLAKLGELIGYEAICDALIASDRGWDVICKIPAEKPALDLIWLSRIESLAEQRYVQLAGRAIAIHTGDRLDELVNHVQRRLREDAFLVALTCDPTADRERTGATCRAVAPRIDRAGLARLLAVLPRMQLLELVRAATDKQVASAIALVGDDDAARIVGELDGEDPPPRDRELAMAKVLASRTHDVIRAWVAKVSTVAEPRTLVTAPVARARRALEASEQDRIATCPHAELPRALQPILAAPTRAMGVTGLTAALERRPAASSAEVCAALLGCADPLDEVARELDRFASSSPEFEIAVDDATAAAWLRFEELAPLAHARLWRWDAHSFGLANWLERVGGVLGTLTAIQTLPGAFARRTLWAGIAEVVVLLRYRDLPRFHMHASDALATFCAERIDQESGGRDAARIVVALVESGTVPLAAVRDLVLDRAADASPGARELVTRIVRLDGMPPPPVVAAPTEMTLLARIRASHDLDELVAWCGDARVTVVQEAALTLATRGELGQRRLAGLLARLGELPQPIAVLQTVVLWDSEHALAAARALAATELPNAWQFHLCVALASHGDPGALPRALAAARANDTSWSFRRSDWEALCRVASARMCALELADSPHYHAYQPAIGTLLPLQAPPEVADALRRFLEVDGERPRHLRVDVAHRLAGHWDDISGLPLLVEHACDPRSNDYMEVLQALPLRAVPEAVELVIAAALVGGDGACSEKRMWSVFENSVNALDPVRREDLYVQILEEASTAVARRKAAPLAFGGALGRSRVQDVAEVFAWGVRRGVELAGRMFTIHLTSNEQDFGHTRLDTNRIFVSPLPMLREEPHGRDVVEGLVLHEIGHHVYHRGQTSQELWKRAHAEGIGHLLNLVADEHLERNLRALDASYGDRLKRLGAYAFQHAPQEMRVAVLLDCLGAAAAPALIATPLDVAFDEQSVRLRRGAVLAELDRIGHPLARFARALRMGLGNRHGDPLIADALARCKGIRSLDMQGLYDLTRALAELFGGTIEVAKVFGGPEGLEFGERDSDVFGAGIDDDILQREVERILHPAESSGRSSRGPRDRLQLNVNPDEDFRKISHVERITGSVEDHRAVTAEVARHAARLRMHLDDLGLRWLPVRARTQGLALDRSRLRALVTRGDPRILIARQPVRRTDLFLGTIVDCSGSMSAGDNIARARRFAILVAEAVRPLPGVEARFFGFTDSTIYDAGDARDCHVTGLEADGGNNDAAALWHAANVALASPQRAKVLVMISDGLPTECSVAALRGLVTKLTKRKGIVCAQVAVRALDEVCFPHYVVLDDEQMDTAVARFGRMIGDLARRSLAS
jgi:hypothetical protein